MGYHPETLAFSFPPYPRGGTSLIGHPKRWSLGRAIYTLKPWIGFDIWHIDPERKREGQRRDDSCGWFDRTPGPYQQAVDEFLRDTTNMHDVKLALDRRKHMPMPFYEGISKPRTETDRAEGYPRLSQADTLALVLMIATQLERTRWWRNRYPAVWWRKPFIRERNVMPLAVTLALNPIDNLSSIEEPESMVRLIAGALHREFRPRWKHPRWHVHHWQVNVDLFRNVRRMFQRCATCRKRLGFGVSPGNPGDGSEHHMECLGWHPAAKENRA
jgi:hypothetical protein